MTLWLLPLYLFALHTYKTLFTNNFKCTQIKWWWWLLLLLVVVLLFFPLLLIEIEGGSLKSILFALNLYGFSLEKAKKRVT